MLQANHGGLAFVSPVPPEVTLRHFELWRESVAESRPVVELQLAPEQPDGLPGYILTVIGRERKRLLADLTHVLHNAGLETVSARIFTMPNQSVMDLFTLRDPDRVLDDDAVVASVHEALFHLIGVDAGSDPATRSPAVGPAAPPGGPAEADKVDALLSIGTAAGQEEISRVARQRGSSSLLDGTSASAQPYFAANIAQSSSFSVDEEREAQFMRIANSKPVGSSLASRTIRRCSSNIAVADLDLTIKQQQNEAASHAQTYSTHTLYGTYPDVDLGPLKNGEWLLYYSPDSEQRYRFKFRLSDDEKYLSWEGRTLRLSACVGVLFGPQSSTFRQPGNLRVDPDWLCLSLVLFPRGGQDYTISDTAAALIDKSGGTTTPGAGGGLGTSALPPAASLSSARGNALEAPEPTTVDLVCESDAQLTSWLFGLQKLCSSSSNRPLYSYEALLLQRAKYKIRTRAHDRGLTTRQYVLKKARKLGEKREQKGAVERHEWDLSQLETEIEQLRKNLRRANARETILATKLHSLQQKWDIDFKELNLIVAIGRGAYSEMWRAEWRSCAVAVKVLKVPAGVSSGVSIGPSRDRSSATVPIMCTDLSPSDTRGADIDTTSEQEFIHEFHDEVVALSELRHPNIVLFMGASVQMPNLCIVTEFCHGGNLYSALRRRSWREHMGHSEFLRMARDAARGMLYLHEARVIHRDFKSQNLLLDRPVESGCPILKIADFGLSRRYNGAVGTTTLEESDAGVMTSETGTYRWMAPEVIRHEKYNEKVDVYSYGITLWELFTCETPFSGLTPIQAAFAVADKDLRPTAVSEVGKAVVIPKAWQALITRCWKPKAQDRPRFSDVIDALDEMELSGPDQEGVIWRTLEKQRDAANTFGSESGTSRAISRSREPSDRSTIFQRTIEKLKRVTSGSNFFGQTGTDTAKSIDDVSADGVTRVRSNGSPERTREKETSNPAEAPKATNPVPNATENSDLQLATVDRHPSTADPSSPRSNVETGVADLDKSGADVLDGSRVTGLLHSGSAPSLGAKRQDDQLA
jgi:serine/threonine protein kinase